MSDPLSDAAIDQLFRTARTANHYLDKPVPETLLRALWDLTALGPTSANQEPARITWCVSQEARDKLADCASGTNAAKIRVAPVALILGMDLEFYEKLPELFPHADARPWFTGKPELTKESAFRNSTLQGAYLIMAARALGLATGPMSGFDAAKVDAAFFEGSSIKSNFIATLGYIDPATVHARLPRLSFEDATHLI
jgi:3-hydroxypropanoate dehydrogenase